MEKTSQLSNAQIQQALKAGIISPSQAKAMRRANDEKPEQSQTASQRPLVLFAYWEVVFGTLLSQDLFL